jgi:TetR/AcrR family transcriptional regulator, transcriptional repressor for nem operon
LGSGRRSRIADPVERAFAFLEDLENFSPELWSGGCLLGSFALELADTNPRMQQAVAQLLQAVTDDFAGKLESIVAHCAEKPAPTATELAEALLGTLEGSIILAKAHRDPTRIPKAIRGFRLSLAGVLSQPV